MTFTPPAIAQALLEGDDDDDDDNDEAPLFASADTGISTTITTTTATATAVVTATAAITTAAATATAAATSRLTEINNAAIWACTLCTFHNDLSSSICAMCATSNPQLLPPPPPPAPLQQAAHASREAESEKKGYKFGDFTRGLIGGAVNAVSAAVPGQGQSGNGYKFGDITRGIVSKVGSTVSGQGTLVQHASRPIDIVPSAASSHSSSSTSSSTQLEVRQGQGQGQAKSGIIQTMVDEVFENQRYSVLRGRWCVPFLPGE